MGWVWVEVLFSLFRRKFSAVLKCQIKVWMRREFGNEHSNKAEQQWWRRWFFFITNSEENKCSSSSSSLCQKILDNMEITGEISFAYTQGAGRRTTTAWERDKPRWWMIVVILCALWCGFREKKNTEVTERRKKGEEISAKSENHNGSALDSCVRDFAELLRECNTFSGKAEFFSFSRAPTIHNVKSNHSRLPTLLHTVMWCHTSTQHAAVCSSSIISEGRRKFLI